jgi:dihydroorotase
VSDQVLIKGVKLYGEGDPVDVLVSDGIIARIGPGETHEDAVVLEAAGQVLLPGLVDLHTHLREPGREDTETIASGSAAAALGGYTAVFAMANTDPVADNSVVVDHVWRRGREVGLVDVHPIGAVTVGLKGEKLAELGTMAKSAANVRVFSDDGLCVADPLLMRRALEYSTALDVVIAQHAEEPRLTVGAQAHEGEQSARLHANARLHICHVSTAGTTDVLRWAKERGTKVSAEVTPHHLLLTDERLTTYDPINKVNPPLRTETDTERLRHALADGVIDCVATDHAPHAVQDKDCEWSAARPGMLGLQTALSIVVETMVRTGLLDWRGVARVMSERPAEIGGLSDHGRPLLEGEPANLTLVDPDAEWTVRGRELASIAANTPYEGMRLPGVVSATLLRGRITSREGKIE